MFSNAYRNSLSLSFLLGVCSHEIKGESLNLIRHDSMYYVIVICLDSSGSCFCRTYWKSNMNILFKTYIA
ncbi:Uncharacterized protein TCM_014941 [Theobroma cacao]|uniref:Uncharacterized protein n=1 Tax=Theobroma cacao TaxID=3641 RepID=A0A061G0I9_THECC|nr:Uncharacterized protein TCM_014941 [Theobroma cacao]